jgi:hypothetical protein
MPMANAVLFHQQKRDRCISQPSGIADPLPKIISYILIKQNIDKLKER